MNFIKNKVKNQISRGLFIASGSDFAVELAAFTGFDWLVLDMEHGLGDEGDILRMIRALRASATAPIVRIPQLRSEYIKKVLDFGAAGIMCPMIKSAQDARDIVDFMRYPPAGSRGFSGGSLASDYGTGLKDYFARANSELLCVAQIEHESAVQNIDLIAAVDGVDVLFIGHSDLSLSMGCFGNFDDKQIIDAENAVLKSAHEHGKVAGMLLKQGMNAQQYVDRGFNFVALGTDVGCLRSAYKHLITSNLSSN
jgi:4-hydroxy-2-oxoheptanedioate aldolase